MIVIVLVSTVIMVPSALIYSVTGYQLMTSNLATLLAGYMIPNNGIANMMCRVYGYNTDEQAEGFISDQENGTLCICARRRKPAILSAHSRIHCTLRLCCSLLVDVSCVRRQRPVPSSARYKNVTRLDDSYRSPIVLAHL
ncbi:hypothetical protein V1506DRAFT_400498 [Lipomyces tetrasporus]